MTKASILLAIINPLIAADLQDQLLQLGYPILDVCDSEERTLSQVRSIHPQLVIMGTGLGSSDSGFQVANIIAQELDIPLIYLVNQAGEKTLQRSQAVGPYGYLFYPVDTQRLYVTIELALEHHKMNRALANKQNWLNAILGSIGDGVIAINEHGEINFMNSVAERLLDQQEGVSIGKPIQDILVLVDPFGKPFNLRFDTLSLGEGKMMDVGFLLASRSGERIPIEFSMSPLIDPIGKIEGRIIVLRNVSSLQRALEEAKRYAERAGALLTSISRLNASLEVSNVLKELLEICISTLKFQVAAVISGSESTNRMSVSSTHSPGINLGGNLTYPMDFEDPEMAQFFREVVHYKIIDNVQDFFLGAGNFNLLIKALDLRTIVIIPLRQDMKFLGVLILGTQYKKYDINIEEITFLQGLANQASLAITHAKLFEAIRAGRERLKNLSLRLVETQENERRLLAKELHDQIGQILTGLQFSLEYGKNIANTELVPILEEAQQTVKNLMREIRELSLELRPSMLDDYGLLPTLNWHVSRYSKQTGIEVLFYHSGLEKRFSSSLETTVYRIIQEALTNLARYAKVDTAEVTIEVGPESIKILVIDHGIGFDPNTIMSSNQTVGLSSMRERTFLIGGDFSIQSAPGEGTQITALLPLNKPLERRKSGNR